jgi:hypothetical protein
LFEYFHPTVNKFSNFILSNETNFKSDGDPLIDLTLIKFLDKFCFKKAKKIKNNEKILNDTPNIEIDEKVIKEDEKFFYKYLQEKKRKVKELKEETKSNKKQKLEKIIKESIYSGNDMDYESDHSYSELNEHINDNFNDEELDKILININDEEDDINDLDINYKAKKENDNNFSYDVTVGDINDISNGNFNILKF